MVLPPDQPPPPPRPRAPASRIRLDSRDARKLRRIIGNPQSASSQFLAAKVVLQAAQGRTDQEIAEALETSSELVRDAVQRFARSRFVSLENRPILTMAAASGAGPTAIYIGLVGDERRQLKKIAQAHTSEQRMVLRANIILLASLAGNNCEIADQLGVDVKTVRKWRRRFSENRMEGLHDAPRSGRPFQFETTARHELFTAVVGPPPYPYGQWSLDLLAKHLVDSNLVGAKCSISIETVSYWLRTADLKPHKVRGWLNSKDPKFQEKRDKIVELYRNPPKDGVLLSVDEKTSIQALERLRKEQPALPGQRRRLEWEYKRHGIANLIASFNVVTGQIISEIMEGKNDSEAFIKFLKQLMMVHPTGKIYLILDNGTTHCSNDTKNFFKANERLVPFFTPTHASWLNQIEIWFSVMSRHALRKVSFSSLDELRKRIESYIELHNRELALPYEWSAKGKPLKGATARERRRQRSITKEFRKAA